MINGQTLYRIFGYVRGAVLLVCWSMVAAAASGAASSFVFIDDSAAGSGFSASAPRAPVGGNPGITLGEQRRRVFERAGEIWGRYLYSPVPIRVTVDFAPLGASTLAAAGPETYERDFANAPMGNTFYPVALANSLAGFDLAPTQADVGVTVSSDATFYLGFDAAVPSGSPSLLDVILHELGHGLGFISLVNSSTGAFFNNRPDAFSRWIFDVFQNLAWTQMTGTQRLNSQLNDPFLVWTGPATTLGARSVLNKADRPTVVAIPEVGDPITLRMVPGDVGGDFPVGAIEGFLVRARDGSELSGRASRACAELLNAAELSGQIALIRRGDCFFDEKVLRAQQAGAIAVIIANNAGDSLLFMGASGEVVETLTIPAVFVGQSTGDQLEGLAAAGARVRFGPAPAGVGTTGDFLRLYAPSEFNSGSSVSHWSTEASPNLLMEPFINRNLDRQLDLTLTQMRDIGWRVLEIPFPYLSYSAWAAETLAPAIAARDPLDTQGAAGITNLERYAFGLSPAAGPEDLPVLVAASDGLELSYLRSTRAAEVQIFYEISEDLVSFRDAVLGVDLLEQDVVPLADSVEEVKLRLPESSEPRRFIRLRIALRR